MWKLQKIGSVVAASLRGIVRCVWVSKQKMELRYWWDIVMRKQE